MKPSPPAPGNDISANAKVGIMVYGLLIVLYLSSLGLWATAVFLGTLVTTTSGSPTGYWLTLAYPAVVILTFIASGISYRLHRFHLAFWVGFVPLFYALLLIWLIFF